MKIRLDANLQCGRGRLFMKGVYEGEGIPKELIAELESGSRHISEVAVPNVKPIRTKKTSTKKQTIRKAPTKRKPAKRVSAKKTPTRKTSIKKNSVSSDK